MTATSVFSILLASLHAEVCSAAASTTTTKTQVRASTPDHNKCTQRNTGPELEANYRAHNCPQRTTYSCETNARSEAEISDSATQSPSRHALPLEREANDTCQFDQPETFPRSPACRSFYYDLFNARPHQRLRHHQRERDNVRTVRQKRIRARRWMFVHRPQHLGGKMGD